MLKIIGLQNGMVMQRDTTNHSDIWFSIIDAEGLDVSVDIGTLTETDPVEGKRKFHLTDICSGGPYKLTLTAGDDSITFSDLYVGDVWVMAGQSNMEGFGYYTKSFANYLPYETIRSYRTEGYWKIAEPRMYQQHHSSDEFIKRYLEYNLTEYWQERGVGPGFSFAQAMQARTGVPQGLISCALKGSSLEHWDPCAPREPEPNLYGIMLRKYEECGGNARGMFWYQGCAEAATKEAADRFTERMKLFVSSFRRDMNRPDMPFVQVQINQFFLADSSFDILWSQIREAQRTLHMYVDNMDTVSVTNAILTDSCHLTSESQEILGRNAAESMYRLCFDPYSMTSTLAPQLDAIYSIPEANDFGSTLAVKYKNLNGRLVSEGRAWGYALSTTTDSIDKRNVFRVDLHNDTAYVRYQFLEEVDIKSMYLSYMFGNISYANITDESGRPIPAMGPLPLKEYLK